MIKVEKGKEPEYLKSEVVDLALEKLSEFYRMTNRSQKRYNFPFNKEIDNELKRYLDILFNRKCGYCETIIQNPNLGVVDRFRPYNGVRDKNEYFQDLYWWLVFNWDNLIYSCRECSQYKANYFPIQGIRAIDENHSLDAEKSLILNPCSDLVQSHFIYNDGFLDSRTNQGLQTIQLLNLNRTSLINRRQKAIYELKVILDRLGENASNVSPLEIDYLNKIYDQDSRVEFLFAKHEQLLKELELKPFIWDYIDNDSDKHDRPIDSKTLVKGQKKIKQKLVRSDYFPIEYLEIKDFKSIGMLRIDFPVDQLEQHAWISLLGENGLGKSSILQAFCLGAAPHIKNGDSQIQRLIKKGKEEAVITIKQRDSDNVLTTRLIRSTNAVEHTGDFFSPIIGYGSTRLLPNEKLKPEKGTNRIRYQNLFDPLIPLNDVIGWLISIFRENKKSFDLIAISLKELLPEEIDDDLTIENEELIFKESKMPYHDLSDGYKGTIALALDIMKTLSDGKTDFSKLSGIVLIDELGNQLHPRWQMRVVKQLKKAFPKVNFIVSTHHPLCLRGLENGEVVVLGKDIDKEIYVVQELPDPASMRVDQLLASEFFGLSSLIDPEIEATFNKYYELLSKGEKITQDERERRDNLKDKLRDKNHFGSTLREELMYTVIDRLLAQKVMFNKEPLNRNMLEDEVVRRVREIWKQLNIETDDQGK